MDEKSTVQPQPPPKKSRWRLSLRTAFILLTLACFALVYIARAEKQRRIVAKFKEWGFVVRYTDRLGDTRRAIKHYLGYEPEDRLARVTADRTNCGRYGDFWENVESVLIASRPDPFNPDVDYPGLFDLAMVSDLVGLKELALHMRGFRDADFKPLARMRSLRSLSLSLPADTDAGLVHIRPLTQLTELSLISGCTDAGIKHLAPLTNLTSLNLYESAITDAGLALLPQHPQLEILRIQRSEGIVGTTFEHFAKLPHLRVLDLSYTSASDESLAHLAKVSSLEWINLKGCSIGDRGLVHLSQCKNVVYLGLDHTIVTDRGLAELVKMPKLYGLDLNAPGVTDQGVLLLKKAPALEIVTFSKDCISREARDEMYDFFSKRQAASAQ